MIVVSRKLPNLSSVRASRIRLNSTLIDLSPDLTLVDSRHSPVGWSPEDAVVYKNFVSPSEGDVLVKDLMSRMKRRRYERGHWDSVISQYKETELSDALFTEPEIPNIFHRVRRQLEANHLDYKPVQWLPCHAIDLKKDGELNAHVDSIKFSGDLVAGLSLISSSIMRLIPDDGSDKEDQAKPNSNESGWIDLYLPPLSLYVLTGDGRFRYSHQLLPDNSTFSMKDGETIQVPREHRISVIFRDTKPK